VTTEGNSFTTRVRGIDGIWPAPPKVWSYSSLHEAEECPRRWMLLRAGYPGVWTRSGYPRRPILPALVGVAVHRVLELILLALHEGACESLETECAVEVLKELGGFSMLANRAIDELLVDLQGNPRVANRASRFRSDLSLRVPEIRRRVQGLISRTVLLPVRVDGSSGDQRPGRAPLAPGSHPEVELVSRELRFVGRADLVTIDQDTCTITDYKTGSSDARHTDQLRIYALLWGRDAELNPRRTPAGRLVVAYATHDEIIEGPSELSLSDLAQQLVSRTSEADGELNRRPPPAKPAPSTCQYCSVRQLCEEYWAALRGGGMGDTPGKPPDFLDCEAFVVRRNGPRSWLVDAGPHAERTLLRTVDEAAPFDRGDRLRLLDVVKGGDQGVDPPTLTITTASEVHVLA
jgi:hypothetical protein